MISKFVAAAAAAGLVLSLAGIADARSHHKGHPEKAMSRQAVSAQATAVNSGPTSNPNLPPQTMPPTPIGKDSTVESPRR